jgi:uncharacterized protein (DUF58 family)
MMNRKDILKRVRLIQIRSRRTVNDVMAGQYASVFRGRGMEFDEVREYQPGDDVRTIDWNVTARTGRPFVKKYVEERELTVIFAVDVSPSGLFGTQVRPKLDLAAELTGVLAFSAIHSNDKVGLLLFSDQVERFVPPGKGLRHGLRILLEIEEQLERPSKAAATNIAGALEYLRKMLHRKAVIFLVSDFQAPDFKRQLQIVNRRHDLTAVSIEDRREYELPRVGLMEVQDLETGKTVLVDTCDKRAMRDFQRRTAIASEMRRRMMQSVGVDLLELRTGEPYLPPLLKLFRKREGRL